MPFKDFQEKLMRVKSPGIPVSSKPGCESTRLLASPRPNLSPARVLPKHTFHHGLHSITIYSLIKYYRYSKYYEAFIYSSPINCCVEIQDETTQACPEMLIQLSRNHSANIKHFKAHSKRAMSVIGDVFMFSSVTNGRSSRWKSLLHRVRKIRQN